MPNGILSFEEWQSAKSKGLDPLTMLPEKRDKKGNPIIPNQIDPIKTIVSKPSQVEDEFTRESLQAQGVDIYASSDFDGLMRGRAEKQGIPEVTANAGLRFLVGQFGEYLSVAGGILDVPADIGRALGADIEFGNALTRWGDEFKKTVDEDWFPIYRSKERDFMDVGDPEWWLENASYLQRAAAGFVVGGFGVAKGLQALGMGAKVARGASLLEVLGMAPAQASRIGTVVGGGLDTFANAYLLNHAEGVMEATDVYNSTYDYWTQKGFSPEEAKQQAALGASATINANRLNILLNLTAASKFFKPLGTARNIIEVPSFKKGLKQAIGEGIQEFAEEEINLLASEYGRNIGMGETPNYMKGMDKVFSMEGLETGFLGMLGGMSQTTMTNLANMSKYNPVSRVKTEDGYISKNEFIKRQAANQQALLDSYSQFLDPKKVQTLTTAFQSAEEQLQDMTDYVKALGNKDEAKARQIAGRGVGYQAVEAFMNGTTEQFIDTLTKASEELVKSTDDAVLAKQYQERGRLAVQMVKDLEAKYNNNEILINRLNIEGNAEDVAKYKNFVKFKVNALNTKQWMTKNSIQNLESMLMAEDATDENTPMKEYAIPYVKREQKELEKYGQSYRNYLSQKEAQANFDKWMGEQKEIQKTIEKEGEEEAKTDNEIELFKQAVSDAGYSQKADENITDLPGIGRVTGVNVVYDGNLYRLTREGDNNLKLVGVENGVQMPFTREFLKENISKLKVLDTDTVKKVFNAKRQQAFKRTQIKAIEQILNNYDTKKEAIQKEIDEYEDQIKRTLEKIENLKQTLRSGLKDKQLRISFDKQIKELKDTVRLGEGILNSLNEQLETLETAQTELNALKEYYLDSLQDPYQDFMSPAQLRNELKIQEEENYLSQKDREILEDSEESIKEAIFYTEQAIERLRRKQDALLKATESLELADKEAVKKFITLKKITQELTELEKDLEEYREDLRLKEEASDLQKSINMIDLHLNALKKRAEKLYTKPEGRKDFPAEGTEIILEDKTEDEVYEQKKTTSMFTTTGMNVMFDTKRISDAYEQVGDTNEYIPKTNLNILENNWFERLALEGIKEGEVLQVVKYSPNPENEKQRMLNQLIRERVGASYIPSEADTFVMVVKEGSPVQYKDKPLIGVLSVADSAFPDNTFKNSRFNISGILQSYAAAAGVSLVYKPGSSMAEIGGKVFNIEKPDIQERIITRVKEKYAENISKLKAGDILEVTATTSGSPLRRKKMENGKLVNDFKPFSSVFGKQFKLKNGKPENFTIQVVVPAGEEKKGTFTFKDTVYQAPSGTAVIMNDKEFKFLYNRTLNPAEVNTVLNLLTMDQDAKISLDEGNYMVISGERVTSIPVFPFSKGVTKTPVSILNSLINYGVKDIKAEYLNEGDLYRSKGSIIYKHNGSVKTIKTNDILNEVLNKDFVEFLGKKRIPVNKHLVHSPGLYFTLQLTRDENNNLTPTWTKYNSYAQYLLNDTAVTNAYVTPAGQSVASVNLELRTDESGNLVVNGVSEKKAPVDLDSYEEMQTSGKPVMVKTSAGMRMEFLKSPLEQFNKTKIKDLPNGLYKLQESILDISNPAKPEQKDIQNKFFVIKDGLYLPAPKGYESLSTDELEALESSKEATINQLAYNENELQHSFKIEGYAASKPKQPVTPVSDIEAKKADIERRRKDEFIKEDFTENGDFNLSIEIEEAKKWVKNRQVAYNRKPTTRHKIILESAKEYLRYLEENTDVDTAFEAAKREYYNNQPVVDESVHGSKEYAQQMADIYQGIVDLFNDRYKLRRQINAKYDAELESLNSNTNQQQKADIERRRQEELDNVKPVYHHTRVKPEEFNFSSFQRGSQSISQFGDGLNASSNTTSFLVNRYGKPIQGEVNDKEFVEIDANKTEKEIYEYLKAKGYKFSRPASEYTSNEKANYQPAIIELFQDFQKSNPGVKGVKVSNHIIGGQKVAPFYVIYDSKSFYGQDSLKNKINAKYDAELAALEQAPEPTTDMFGIEETVPVAQIFSESEIVVAEEIKPEITEEQELDFDSLVNAELGQEETVAPVENINTVDEGTRESLLSQLQEALKTAPFAKKGRINAMIQTLSETSEITDELIDSIKKVCE